jgi:hypothetical protein
VVDGGGAAGLSAAAAKCAALASHQGKNAGWGRGGDDTFG